MRVARMFRFKEDGSPAGTLSFVENDDGFICRVIVIRDDGSREDIDTGDGDEIVVTDTCDRIPRIESRPPGHHVEVVVNERTFVCYRELPVTADKVTQTVAPALVLPQARLKKN